MNYNLLLTKLKLINMKKINTLVFNDKTYSLVFDNETTSSDRTLSLTQFNYDLYENGEKLNYQITLFNKMDWEENDKTLGMMIEFGIVDTLYHNRELDSLEIDFEKMCIIINVVREHQSE